MSMNIYVANLPHATTEDRLREAFEAFGVVSTVSLIRDKVHGLFRGFAFVEMPTALNAAAAIKGLNGRDFDGIPLTVKEVKPREERTGNRFGNRGDNRSK
jgi:cold-inducible RNA-binding protein